MAKNTPPPKKNFEIQANVKLVVGVIVEADSLEDALDYGRRMKVNDYISFDGNNHIDSDTPTIVGVFEQ